MTARPDRSAADSSLGDDKATAPPPPWDPGRGVWRRRVLRILDPLWVIGLGLAIGLWYLAAWSIGKNIPYPHAVLDNAMLNLFSSAYLPGIGLPRGGYYPHLAYTFGNVLLGGTIGAVVGTLSGLLSAESRTADQITGPIVSLLGTVPIIVAAPFFLLWFGISAISQIALVAFYTAVVLHVFTMRGVHNQPPTFPEYAATLGATRMMRFFSVRLPGVVPEIVGGLRIAFAGAWGLAAVTEMLGAQFGTGRVLIALRSVYDLTGILTIVILLGVIAIFVDGCLVALRAWSTRWAQTGGGL